MSISGAISAAFGQIQRVSSCAVVTRLSEMTTAFSKQSNKVQDANQRRCVGLVSFILFLVKVHFVAFSVCSYCALFSGQADLKDAKAPQQHPELTVKVCFVMRCYFNPSERALAGMVHQRRSNDSV